MFFSNHPMTFLTGHQGLNLTKQSCHGRAQGAKFEDGGGVRGHSPRHQSGGRAPQLIVARDARAEWLGIARVITGVFQTSGSLWIRHGPTGFGGALADSCIEQPCFFGPIDSSTSSLNEIKRCKIIVGRSLPCDGS